jgi:uncharacterized ion transporter superfamily protein YfcC
MRLPHPVLLLLAGTAIAACLTWLLPAGEFDRRDDSATGRRVVVAGTFHGVTPAPVSPFAAAVAVPRGIVAAADVVGVILFVGGAWFVLDRLGTLTAVVGALVRIFGHSGLLAIPPVALFFGAMGALENMQEEIIPLVPVLLVLGRGLGIDAVSVVAMSAGAAMVGSAFGPTNPFQAGIALKLAQESPLSGGALRLAMFVVALALWIAATMRHAASHRTPLEPSDSASPSDAPEPLHRRHALALAAVLLPMGFYVYGALRLDWGFNELSAAFLIGGSVAGLIGGFGPTRTAATYLQGMEALVPAAVMVGIARSISMVLDDGHVVDTILNALAARLSTFGPTIAALLMVPFHALVHIAVPSISGQAVLTMPLMVPLADLLHFSRQVSVLAYQTGGGLMELFTPTNGALMAVLLAAGVPYTRWLRFATVAGAIQLMVGIAGILAALVLFR